MSLLCGALTKGSAWETRSQSLIISFLGLSQETHKGPEGTLIRSRKQHQELAFSPTGKRTQPSKTRTETFLNPLHFPRDHAPLPQSHTAHPQAPMLSPYQAQSSIPSVHILHVRRTRSPCAQPSLLGRLGPANRSHLQHLRHLHCLVIF